MLKAHVLEQAEELEISSDAFTATWQWRNGFMKRHRFSFRTKTHTGQTAPTDALEQAAAFAKEVSRRAKVGGIKTIYNADQTVVFFELLPRTTITEKGTKTVWVKCGKKAKERMTAMVLGDSHGNKFPLFLVMKTSPSKAPSIGEENKRVRHGFGRRLWTEIEPLQDEHNVCIYGNQSGWWTGALTVEFLRFHFGHRSVFSDPVMLLLDDFSGHWVVEAWGYARVLNVVLVKVPPGLTWLCQPAGAVLIKPIKDRLRRHWLGRLQHQIAEYRANACASPFEMKTPDRGKVASEAWNYIPSSKIVSGFSRCILSMAGNATGECEELTDMQDAINAVVRDLEGLEIVNPLDEALEDKHDVVD